jgi:thioredoxin reductase (NADPH)
VEKIVILGSGPAGLTAALYLARAQLRPLLVGGSEPGGQLTITSDVENYPGFPEGIQGPDLMQRFRKQAERFGTRIRDGSVTAVDLSGSPRRITIEGGETIECEALVVATGASAQWLGLESETALRGMGVSSCATCDGFFFLGKELIVVGGGDTALEDALYLTHFATQITVVHRRDALRASRYMQEKALAHEKIGFAWNSVVDEIRDPARRQVTGVVLRDVKTGAKREVPCDGVFVAIGHRPNTQLFRGQLEMDPVGYLRTRPASTRTDRVGVFAAGDVADPRYRQAISAAGSGCMAAIDAERFLGGEPWE